MDDVGWIYKMQKKGERGGGEGRRRVERCIGVDGKRGRGGSGKDGRWKGKEGDRKGRGETRRGEKSRGNENGSSSIALCYVSLRSRQKSRQVKMLKAFTTACTACRALMVDSLK